MGRLFMGRLFSGTNAGIYSNRPAECSFLNISLIPLRTLRNSKVQCLSMQGRRSTRRTARHTAAWPRENSRTNTACCSWRVASPRPRRTPSIRQAAPPHDNMCRVLVRGHARRGEGGGGSPPPMSTGITKGASARGSTVWGGSLGDFLT